MEPTTWAVVDRDPSIDSARPEIVEVLENRLAGQTSDLVRLHRSAETGRALLDLHTACTRQRTVVGTARQIAAVASAMTGSDVVTVGVFQAVSQQPLLAVSIGDGDVDEDQLSELVFEMAAEPEMAWLHTENRQRVVSRETATPSTSLLLAELQAARIVITPLFGQGEFVGFVIAKLPETSSEATSESDDVTVIEGAGALQAHAGDLIHLALVLEELRRRALHDAVTGLPNLAVYEQRLVRALARRAASQLGHVEVSSILVQVKEIDRVGELHGATGSQELAREIANRLTGLTAEHDLGHLSAGHFALIAHGEQGAGVDLARAAVELIEAPYALSFGQIQVTCHVGVAVAEDEEPASGLLRRAEMAARAARGNEQRIVVDD